MLCEEERHHMFTSQSREGKVAREVFISPKNILVTFTVLDTVIYFLIVTKGVQTSKH